MLDKRIINTAVAGVTPSACTTDTVQILDGVPFESIATYQLDGNANDLTTNYNGTWSGTEAYTTGQFGQAAVFNGSNSYIVTTTLPTLNSFTLSFWMKSSDPNADRCIFNPSIGSITGAIGLFSSGTTFGFFPYDSAGGGFTHISSTETDSLFDNNWHHVAIVSADADDVTQAAIYVDGVSKTLTTQSGETKSAKIFGQLYFGRRQDGYANYDGSLDQVRIYNKALSEDNVATLYNETVATASTNPTFDAPSLVAYYKMSDATDETGSYDGTPSNVNFNVAGKFGNAGEFNGSSSEIVAPNSLLPSSGGFSISWWQKTTQADSTYSYTIDNSGGSAQNGIYIITHNVSTGFIVGFKNGSVFQPIIPYSSAERTQWTHFCISWDGTTSTDAFKIYKNNVPTSFTSSVTNGGGFYPFKIGRSYNGTNWFGGSIDQVRIFNRAITSEEVETLYNEVHCIPDIVPASNFNTVIWSADGTSGDIDINSVGFQPDFVWAKIRTQAYSHTLFDSVRGVGSTHMLWSDETTSESGTTTSASNNGFVSSFNIDGFTGATGANVNAYFNSTGNDYVAWCWKAADTTTAISAGTVGNTIASDVRANQDAGFSVVKYTGTNTVSETIGHGLSSAPELVIIKNIDVGSNWFVFPKAIGNFLLRLNTAGAEDTTAGYQLGTVDNSIFTLPSISSDGWNQNYDFIAYCFHSVDGYQKVGSYKGTGAAGNTIVTGFRPAFVMVKSSSNAEPWFILDNKRDASNPRDNRLMADSAAAESDGSVHTMDFNLNGFTLNGTVGNGTNGSNVSYIFLAIAEEAFVPDNFFNDDSTVATYKLDGDAGDSSGNGYNGVATDVTYSTGEFDDAAVFNGSSSKISLGSLNQFSGNTVSFSLWFNSTDVSATKILLGSNVNAIFAGELDLYTYNSGFLLTVATASNVYRQWTTPASLSNNTWHNVVVTLDSATSEVAKIYLDGNEQTKSILGQSGTISGALLNSASNLNLGVDNVPASYFNGKIDQVRIFDRVLDSGEVAQLANE